MPSTPGTGPTCLALSASGRKVYVLYGIHVVHDTCYMLNIHIIHNTHINSARDARAGGGGQGAFQELSRARAGRNVIRSRYP